MRSRPRSRPDLRFRTPPASALTQALPRQYSVVMAFFNTFVSNTQLYIVHDGLMTGDQAIWNAANFTDFKIDGVAVTPISVSMSGAQYVVLNMTDDLEDGQLLSFRLVHPDSRRFPAALVVDLPVIPLAA